MLTGLASSVRSLAGARFLLGAGESGLYTISPKVVGELFPPEQRGLAVGIYTAGATIGATLAPPLIAYLAIRHGWRSAFVATGTLGLIWIVPWLLFYRPAAKARPAVAPQPVTPRKDRLPWHKVVFNRQAFLLLAARTLTDPVWHFVLFWCPKYLTDVQHMSLEQVGRIAWTVYLAADVGSIAGGFVSGRLIAFASVPVAFLVSARAAEVTWLLLLPARLLVSRHLHRRATADRGGQERRR